MIDDSHELGNCHPMLAVALCAAADWPRRPDCNGAGASLF